MRRPGAGGFSLVELLLFVVLASLALGAAGWVSASALRMFMRQSTRSHLQLAAVELRELLARDVLPSHHIVQPASGTGSTVLEGYIGRLYTGAPGSPWVHPNGGAVYARFLYCVDGSGQLWYYRDQWALAVSPAPIACGQPGGRSLVKTPSRVDGLWEAAWAPPMPAAPGALFWRGSLPFPQNLLHAGVKVSRAPSAREAAPSPSFIQLTLAASFSAQPPP